MAATWLRAGAGYVQYAMLALTLLSSGCFWQRDSYTRRMETEMANFERRAEIDRLLGVPFDNSATEYPLWIRPPKPTELRAVTEEQKQAGFIAVFQGSEGGSALIEVMLIGSAGDESLSEFIQKSMAALENDKRGPGAEVPRRDPTNVTSMHGGSTSFDVLSTGGQRAVQGAQAPVGYQWVYYFTEDSRQKLMLAFIVPDAKYSDFTNAMQKCLESVALGSKVSYARSGTTAPATPSTGP